MVRFSNRQAMWFTRATNIYRQPGQRRKVAPLERDRLWDRWPIRPQNIVLPDGLDAQTGHHYFYGMPVRYYAGIYWGFLWPYRHGKDIHTELAFSRDGKQFDGLSTRPKLIARGPAGAWDDGMVFGVPRWLEMGDQWWIYYSGSDGPHNSNTRKPGIGLARLCNEGFVFVAEPARRRCCGDADASLAGGTPAGEYRPPKGHCESG